MPLAIPKVTAAAVVLGAHEGELGVMLATFTHGNSTGDTVFGMGLSGHCAMFWQNV